jgi:mRNA-degrading endonuclease RelE of RelBE toxin-antitoxin system
MTYTVTFQAEAWDQLEQLPAGTLRKVQDALESLTMPADPIEVAGPVEVSVAGFVVTLEIDQERRRLIVSDVRPL